MKLKHCLSVVVALLILNTSIISNAASFDESKVPLNADPGSVLFFDIEGNVFSENSSVIVAKADYDISDGRINNIYYRDTKSSTGFSIHNAPISSKNVVKKPFINGGISIQSKPVDVHWHWGNGNYLTYKASDDTYNGTGRATYYTGPTGNRSNTLKDHDVATQINHDYSKKGDKDITIKNPSTGYSGIYYQADVGSLPDAVIDIWGLSNLRELAGSTTATSVSNITYKHKRFSDQVVPRN